VSYSSGKAYVEVRSLCVSYTVGGLLGRRRVAAVRGVSFDIRAGQCFALVGESGSGKSSIARALLGLLRADSGSIRVGDFCAPGLAGTRRAEWAKEVQAVFQDPFLSLNPRLSVKTIIEEPLAIQGVPRRQRKYRVLEVLSKVRLGTAVLDRRPMELSGGERQRVCIARALAPGPRFLIADEPVSSLDVRVQAGVIDLLLDLKEQDNLTLLLVSHDMDLVRFAADEVGVLYAGRLVEAGPVAQVYSDACHPYTRSLMDASPELLRRRWATAWERAERSDVGAALSRTAPPDPEAAMASMQDATARRPPAATGCAYRNNCTHEDLRCASKAPPLVVVDGDHRASCYKQGHAETLPLEN